MGAPNPYHPPGGPTQAPPSPTQSSSSEDGSEHFPPPDIPSWEAIANGLSDDDRSILEGTIQDGHLPAHVEGDPLCQALQDGILSVADLHSFWGLGRLWQGALDFLGPAIIDQASVLPGHLLWGLRALYWLQTGEVGSLEEVREDLSHFAASHLVEPADPPSNQASPSGSSSPSGNDSPGNSEERSLFSSLTKDPSTFSVP